MNTSDPTKAATDLSGGEVSLGSLEAILAGLPDPAALTKLANEFFREGFAAAPTPPARLPGASELAAVPNPAGAPTLAAAPVVPPSAAPTHAQLHSLPASLSSAAPSSVPSGLASVPGIPGGFSLSALSTEPSFSFLQDARSIVASAPAAPVQTIPQPIALVPNQASLAAPTSSIPAVAQTAPKSLPDIVSPQIPGAHTRTSEPDELTATRLLAGVNPLESFDGVPTLAPYTPNVQTVTPTAVASSGQFDVNAIRRDFPILSEQVNGRQLVWLDNAATTQKPQAVIDRLSHFYSHENSNIHRAAHTLTARSTDAYEGAREKVRRFLNAPDVGNIIFVRGATEGINLVAQSWGRKNIQKDDEIIVTVLEHHANIVPWQMLCAEKGAKLRVAPVDNTGQVLLDEYEKLFNSRTKFAAFTQVSNALGTVTPVAEMTQIAHRHGAKVLVDGAQAVSHMAVDVQTYDCDFYVFSGHKVFAPTGIGAVYGKTDVLENTPPWQGGGNMIADVTFKKTLYQPPPWRFEAGTGNIADAVGLGAAIDYVQRIGMANISRYEHDLLVYGTEALQRIPGVRLIGTAREKASVLSFVLDGFKTEDVGAGLSREGIAVRSGHHCAQPILRRFGVESTVRPSLAFYNTCEEIDALTAAIWNIKNARVTSVV